MTWIIAASVLLMLVLVLDAWWHERTKVEMPTIQRHPKPYDYAKEQSE